jgi:hypothetical protein
VFTVIAINHSLHEPQPAGLLFWFVGILNRCAAEHPTIHLRQANSLHRRSNVISGKSERALEKTAVGTRLNGFARIATLISVSATQSSFRIA